MDFEALTLPVENVSRHALVPRITETVLRKSGVRELKTVAGSGSRAQVRGVLCEKGVSPEILCCARSTLHVSFGMGVAAT